MKSLLPTVRPVSHAKEIAAPLAFVRGVMPGSAIVPELGFSISSVTRNIFAQTIRFLESDPDRIGLRRSRLGH